MPPPVRRAALVLCCAPALIVAEPAHAQRSARPPLSVELRGGVALPSEDFADDAQVDGGFAGEVSATWQALPLAGLYAAYQASRFEGEGRGAATITDYGLAAGVRVGIPSPLLPIDPWIRAGVVAHRLHAVNADRTAGWELAGGLGFPLGRALSLTPGAAWTRYRPGPGADGPRVDVAYLRADVGLRLRL